jgi:hypothetical protein
VRQFLKRRFLVPVFIGVMLTLLAVLVRTTGVPILSEPDHQFDWLA